MDQTTQLLANEDVNTDVLGEAYEILARTVDYIFIKNLDEKIAKPLTSKDDSESMETPSAEFTNNIVASLMCKNLRDKFKL